MESNLIDLSLKLIGGRPVQVDGFGEIKPLKLKEIIDYGYSKYSSALNIFSITKESLKDTVLKDIKDEDLEFISNLEILIMISPDDLIELIEEACVLFFRCNSAYVDKEEYFISLNYSESPDIEKFVKIDRNNFDKISEIIKVQNYIKKVEEVESSEKKESKEVREFKERLKKLREEANKAKKRRDGENDEDSNIGLYEIISSLSSKSNVNEFEIMNLTIYQLYTKFKRVEVVSKYDIDISSILAGVKDVKVKHWSTKISD